MSRARDLADGTFSGAFSADSPTLVVDATNNNVGIGTTTPSRPMSAQTTSNGASFLAYRTSETNGDYGGIEFHNHPSDITAYRKGAIYFRSNGGGFGKGELSFCIDNASDNGNVGLGDEKMRLGTGYDNAGTLYLGNYVGSGPWDDPGANNTTGITFRNLKSGYPAIMTCSQGSHYLYRVGTGEMWHFGYKSSLSASTTDIGSISTNGSSTSYNTSSDYRLKEDWQPMSGSIDRVKSLNPVNFAWKSDGSRVDGFLAHEVADVVPEAIHGTKDEADEEGNPIYQGIDQSKLVPLLTAALQEAITKIEALEARVAILETA